MKKTTAKCQYCRNEFETSEMLQLSLANRGGGVSYLCNECAEKVENYSTKNNATRGFAGHGFSYGFEFETSDSNAEFRIEIASVDFIATSDASLGVYGVEYKSPVYYSLNPLPKKLYTIEEHMNNGNVEIDEHCGTHFHVGHRKYINYITMEYIREYYKTLFIPLSEIMKSNRHETEKLFGRYFNDYADTIKDYSRVNDRYNFVNVTNNKTIEFRLPVFRNAEQYMKCVHFCDDVVNTIIKNFICHYNDDVETLDKRRYKTIEQYRQHKAEMTAKKLVKLFEKYTSK
jgi:hypothetical protein